MRRLEAYPVLRSATKRNPHRRLAHEDWHHSNKPILWARQHHLGKAISETDMIDDQSEAPIRPALAAHRSDKLPVPEERMFRSDAVRGCRASFRCDDGAYSMSLALAKGLSMPLGHFKKATCHPDLRQGQEHRNCANYCGEGSSSGSCVKKNEQEGNQQKTC